MATLNIISCSAITAVGLDAFQTCASIRSRISGFRACLPRTPPLEPLIAAKVPAHSALRSSHPEWLANLACRAIEELLGEAWRSVRLGLILSLSPTLGESGDAGTSASEFISLLELKLSFHFAQRSILEEGGAGSILALAYADEMLRGNAVDFCVVGGVDSLLNANDLDRLQKTHRLQDEENPDGLIPGEGATFALVSKSENQRAIAQVLGVGTATEADSVLSPRYSQGAGLVAALGNAVGDSLLTERDLSFRVSNLNGERYAAWEATIAVPRFYRTRRERLPVWYPASSVGDAGAASGMLTLVLAAFAIAGGYAPGPYAVCEASSDHGLRAACLVGSAAGAPTPPFRAEEGATRHILERIQLPRRAKGRVGES